MSLDRKVVIITGSAAGIGAATAKLFARRGANLCLLDIDEDGLKKVETDCKDLGAGVLALRCDASLLPEIDKAITETIRRFNGIDILVNNAIFRAIKPFLEVEEEEFDKYTLNSSVHLISNNYSRFSCAFMTIRFSFSFL